MKILMINNFSSILTGVESCLKAQTALLRAKGHEVYIFSTDKKPYINEVNEYTEFFPKYTQYSALSTIEALKYTLKSHYNLEAERNLSLMLEKIRPDIAHAHNIIYHLSPSVLNACYKKHIPAVITLHGADFICPGIRLMLGGKKHCKDELCKNNKAYNCFLNKCADGNLYRSIFASGEFYFRKSQRMYEKISAYICPSQALMELALRSGMKKEKLSLITNFADNNLLKNTPEYSNKGYFLYAGRLAKEKGIEYLLRAMYLVPKDLKLHLVGTGPFEAELKKLCLELELNNVYFMGFKSGKELEEEYKNSIGVVLPSNSFEIFGLTLIEAYSWGKPVIASNIGGMPEVVDNNITGIVVEPENIGQLADAMDLLYNNNQLVINMGIKGRKKVETIYNPEMHYSKLIKLYNLVIQAEK